MLAETSYFIKKNSPATPKHFGCCLPDDSPSRESNLTAAAFLLRG